MLTALLSLPFVLALLAMVGCGHSTSSGGPSLAPVNHNPAKAAITAPSPAGSTVQSHADAQATAASLPKGNFQLIDASFDLEATALGLTICKGVFHLQVNTSLSPGAVTQLLNVPNGSVDCSLLGSIDLGQVLSGVAQPLSAGSVPAVVNGGVIAVNNLGGGTYTPARPFFPAFLTGTPSQLRNLNLSQNLTLTSSEGTATGNVQMTMNSYDQPFTAVGHNFPHVMDFTMTNTGFTGVQQRLQNFLFDTMSYKLSTDPVAILEIDFKGSTTALLTSTAAAQGSSTGLLGWASTFMAGPGSFAQGLTNMVSISMTLKLNQQAGLDQAIAAASAPNGHIVEKGVSSGH